MSSQSPHWWSDAKQHIRSTDPILAKLIDNYPDVQMRRQSKAFEVLVKSIIGQQISTKAASTMFERLAIKVAIEPSAIVANQSILDSAAMSNSKKKYIFNIARWFHDNNIDESYFQNCEQSQLGEQLLAIKGIGPWTWNMFQMFYLHNSNILPLADLGLLNGFAKLYEVKDTGQLKDIIAQHSAKFWSPYATLAVWFIWRYLDGAELNY